jgi:hypothetical protein
LHPIRQTAKAYSYVKDQLDFLPHILVAMTSFSATPGAGAAQAQPTSRAVTAARTAHVIRFLVSISFLLRLWGLFGAWVVASISLHALRGQKVHCGGEFDSQTLNLYNTAILR